MAGEQTKVSCLHHPGLYGPIFLGSIFNWFSLAHFSYFSIDNIIQMDAFVAKKTECTLLKTMCIRVGFDVGTQSKEPHNYFKVIKLDSFSNI